MIALQAGGASLFDPVHHNRSPDVECRADSQKAVHAQRCLAPFHIGNVAAVHFRTRRHRLLRQPRLFPELAEHLADNDCRRAVARHNGNVKALASPVCRV